MTSYVSRDTLNKPLAASVALAELSRCRQKHGAILMNRGRLVSSAVNIKYHTPEGANWRSSHGHAEEIAVRQAGKGR